MIERVEKIEKRRKEILQEQFDLELELVEIRQTCKHMPKLEDGIPGPLQRTYCTRCGQILYLGCKKGPERVHVHEPGERDCIYCGIQITGK